MQVGPVGTRDAARVAGEEGPRRQSGLPQQGRAVGMAARLLTAALLLTTALVSPAHSQAAPANGQLALTQNGATSYVIVTAPDASAAVKRAAHELADDLIQITGAPFTEQQERPTGPAIYVGGSSLLPASLAGAAESVKRLPEESFIIRSAGPDILLAGRDERGCLYAVYTFLEKYVGARWYAPDATRLPWKPEVTLPALQDQQTPAFAYRDTDEFIVYNHAPWDAHLKLNGTSVPDDAAVGGINRLFNGAENFYDLVPPAKYSAAHPEYFSLVNGQRRWSGDSQLCLTNPDVFKIVVDDLVTQAHNDPKLLTLGLSPNDAGDGNCQDEACKISDARYGAPSGTLLDFVNKVAGAVQGAMPQRKVWVETLAYQYTERAPNAGSIHPADNVLVCLAPIYACDGHPLATDSDNVKSNAALKAWSQVAPGHLQVWHYVTDFANYLQPYPDWDELGVDMDYYRTSGVSGMFCEGNYNSPGELQAMRTWVMAHLFWDTHQDVWALAQDFCNGYYGPAGGDIYAYLRLFHDRLQQPGVHLHLYDPPTANYMPDDLLARANALFDHAEAITSGAYKDRVQEARLALRYVELMRTRPTVATAADQRAAFHQKLDAFVKDLRRFKVTYTSEGGPADRWIENMQKL